ncbi:MAG: D-amino-acid dehydrogenase [Crocinitomicaceae bacterium]|jgi:D-amino-acid dehydrogenase
MTGKKHIVVVGGGIIGLFSAYYLVKSGHRVTIVDKDDLSDGCSHGNAGMIVPSHVIPMAAPGMISQGMKWMFSSKSPFYVRPRMSSSLFNWGMKFYRSASEEHVANSIPALRDLSLLSKDLFQDLAAETKSFFYEEKGLLMLYCSDKMGHEEIETAKRAQNAGLEVDFLSKEAVKSVETGVVTNAIGGVHYKSDAHVYPNKLMAYLKQSLTDGGVNWQLNTQVTGINKSGDRILSLKTSKGSIEGDEFVIAGGAWSPEIAKKIGMKLSILPGKGYSFTLKNPAVRPVIPSILCEGKVAVTPMGNDLRFGGTLEITHTNDSRIRQSRVQGILETIHQFYPTMSIDPPVESDIWVGFRPCSPDGLPYIGKCNEASNLICATGHSMMGLSLGPATGKLVEELINDQVTSVGIDRFSPTRKI